VQARGRAPSIPGTARLRRRTRNTCKRVAQPHGALRAARWNARCSDTGSAISTERGNYLIIGRPLSLKYLRRPDRSLPEYCMARPGKQAQAPSYSRHVKPLLKTIMRSRTALPIAGGPPAIVGYLMKDENST
jgi:hypothetical protein